MVTGSELPMKSSSASERASELSATDHVKKEGIQVASFVKSIGSFSILLLILGGAATHAQTAHFSGAQVTFPIGSLTNPYGMAVDSSGNMYVADNANNSLSKLTPSGALSAGFLSGDGSPYGVAVDGSGNLYITDNLRNEVVKETLQPGGYYTKSLLPINGLNSPLGIAVDAHGNVYIADYLNNRVVKATPSGSTYTQSTVPTSTLSLPEAVAIDGSGNRLTTGSLGRQGQQWQLLFLSSVSFHGVGRSGTTTSEHPVFWSLCGSDHRLRGFGVQRMQRPNGCQRRA
jgi:streptogramin lyase